MPRSRSRERHHKSSRRRSYSRERSRSRTPERRKERRERDDRDSGRERRRRDDDDGRERRRRDDRDGGREREESRERLRDRDRKERVGSYDRDDDRRRRRDGSDSRALSRQDPTSRRSRSPPSNFTSGAVARRSPTPPPKEKEKPNFQPTGLLAQAANATATGEIIKFHAPFDAARAPTSKNWNLFVFQGKDVLETLNLSEKPDGLWRIGGDYSVNDIIIGTGDSKATKEEFRVEEQHCVLQFRKTEQVDEFGDRKRSVKPYLLDLETKGGTKLNGEKIPKARMVEVKSGDVIRVGRYKEREFVVVAEKA